MALSKWRLKQLWMYPFMRTQRGADLYDWLTAGVLGTQWAMSQKWCYWFREHTAAPPVCSGCCAAGSVGWSSLEAMSGCSSPAGRSLPRS